MALLTSEDDYQRYLDKGIPLLQNIDKHWLAADLNGKQHIVGSIFPQKLVFEKDSYRTIGENPVLTLIASTGAGSSTSKKKKGQQNADLSTWVPGRRNLLNLFAGDLEAIITFCDVRNI